VNLTERARRLAEGSARRPRLVAGCAALLVVVSVLLALQLDTSASPGDLYDRDSSAGKATDRLHSEFGEDAVLIHIRTRQAGCPGGRNCHLTDLLLTPDLIRVLSLEGCISGNIPRGAKVPAPICRTFSERKPFVAVNGPGTFINESARQISARIRSQQRRSRAQERRAAEAAKKIAAARGLGPADQARLEDQARKLAQLNAQAPALQYGLSSRGAGIADPSFVHQLVFDPSISFDAPKTRFAELFPSRTSAVIELRPQPGLGSSERHDAVALVRKAVSEPAFHLGSARYYVTGEPVLSDAVASEISHDVVPLIVATLVIAAIVLLLGLRSRGRLLALVPAAVTVALTFGGMAITGTSLTIASLAVLPVLGGLAAGHAAHFARTGAAPLLEGVATAVCFLLLVLAPVPMIRTFGLWVSVGVVLSLLVTLTVGAALFREIEREPFQARRGGWTRRLALRRPRVVLLVALLLGVLGWLVAPKADVVSSLERLGPSDLREAKELRALGQDGGMERDVSVLVDADDLAAPGVLSWMVRYQSEQARRQGYSEERPCRQAKLCPAVPLGSLFGSGRVRSRSEGRALLDRLPPYFTRGVVADDGRTARIPFLLRRMSLEDQRQVLDDMRAGLNPPKGVRAQLAGAQVVAIEAGTDFESGGRELALLSLLAVFALVAIAARRVAAVVPLLPVALATGWCALIVVVLGVTLNPLSANIGVFAVALGTYGAIVLARAYREERSADATRPTAVMRAYGRLELVGLVIALALGGFTALIASDLQMLRETGWLVAVDLAVVLAGVALVLPAALAWDERRRPLRVPRSRAEWGSVTRRLRERAVAADRLPAQGP
jgi:uncharacterized protein